MDDWQLLQAYANNRSEAAFTELVRLHLDWVYSVALRQLGDSQMAEDVVQSVFVLLAKKAGELRPGTILGGWLFRTTCHVSAHARRAEYRRKNRETTASAMNHDSTPTDGDEILWQQLVPHLDLAVAALSEADRSAILLRFYEKAPMLKVAEKLGVSEEAAKKRVSRAIEKMRQFLARRGVKPTSGVLGAVLAEKTVQAAPGALAGTVVRVSVAAISASSSLMLPQLARQTLGTWHWAKIKLGVGLAASSLALVFVVATAGGWLARHSAAPSDAVSRSQGPGPGATAPPQVATARSVRNVNNTIQASPKTGAITGSVLDEDNHPVAGAKVWGGIGQVPFAQDITDSSGQFALDKIAKPPFVTVTADGYAADQQEFNPTNAPSPLVFHLSRIPPLKVRAVDESGQGVAGVRLFLYQWWGRPGTLGQDSPQQAHQTEADGSLQWLSPPKGELELQFVKAGYRVSRTNKFASDGEEHVIVLHPTATVTGNVTDAETGAPVPSFKFTMGHSQPWNPSDPVPMWDFRGKVASNGFYQMMIEEESRPYLRIETDGYDTIETEIQLTNELADVRDFQLTRTRATNFIRGIVLLPDGDPAAGVEVALCTYAVGVMLRDTAFDPRAVGNINPNQQGEYRRTTDAQGSFSFEPKPGAHTVVAVSLAGLGQAHCFDFSKPIEIQLQPWGRIEGMVRTRDGQWGGRTVKWRGPGSLSPWGPLNYDSKSFSTRSDAAGKFLLQHVPPGDGRLEMEDSASTASVVSASFLVIPGETARVQIGGLGSPVTGKLVAPPGVEIRSWTNQVTIAQLSVEYNSYNMPGDLTGIAAERWKLEFADSEAGRAWLRDQYSYDFKVEADGSFSIPEVLPGKYRLFVNVSQGNLGSGPDLALRYGTDPQIASGGMKIEVPNAPEDNGSPVDLGEIILTAAH